MKPKNLYNIVLPFHLNPDVTALFLNAAGGFTSWEAKGGWKDPKSGAHLLENHVIYQVACSLAQLTAILKGLTHAFPGERCWYVTHLGKAHFYEASKLNPQLRKAAP